MPTEIRPRYPIEGMARKGQEMTTLFNKDGIHAIVDGQFGSTGKGALAYWLATQAAAANIYIDGSIYSGGPNSGHTFYHDGEKHVNKQLPSFAVALSLITNRIQTAYLSAGAIINPEILFAEADKYPKVKTFVHPNAAIVYPSDIEAESTGTIAETASTRSGTGAAQIRKISRDPTAIWGNLRHADTPGNVTTLEHRIKPESKPYTMEVAQGFSLGINQRFYPKSTSRECTVSQGLADAGLPPSALKRTYMSIRTFPIRVGNFEGHSSGGWYDDQKEITWEQLGVEPELTTVTQRVRRVATFSWEQFDEALRANHPDFVFANFLNYLSPDGQKEFLDDLKTERPFGVPPYRIIEGRGPRAEDITADVDIFASGS
jgi:adenylosuccinate synthase